MESFYEEEKKIVHRHPTLYKILGLIFLGITMVLISIDVVLDWPASTRAAVLILSLFPFLLALVYFLLATQEERGF
ncbi:hypothetical protein [Ktedonobacter robiniae]|uniref:Cardiolipin synthase N-terminal domain-containing protein n=1 Tax=Ktedonobacter robiniae TaxID=2778365 RepID=A0ABQ3V5Z1_9CHLR|nr:hypothetical protein [Ktedonobacter robiniae]GHO60382.1 hypothetical protein KSB_88570 [Ktedonobacter robiniae]